MNRRSLHRHRLVRAGILVGVVGAVVLAAIPAATGSGASERLHARVVATQAGPIPACSVDACTDENTVWTFVYVQNRNELTNSGRQRDVLPNAFVVSSVDQAIFVDGVQTAFTNWRPPPDISPSAFISYSGRWPSTVKCTPSGPPCGVVGSPAILPGEDTAVFYAGWAHGDNEPNGNYVFSYTVHGTVNGAPVDVTASSPVIPMTD